jgi:polysaccharide export outer membrane protein
VRRHERLGIAVCLCIAWSVALRGVSAFGETRSATAAPHSQPREVGGEVQPPSDYVIGPDDILTITVWREKDLSGDVLVRPDGRVTLPLVGDLDARGLRPDELRDRVTQAMTRYVADPAVTVVVKQINSRKVFITGQVTKPGAYPLGKPATVLQLIAIAGGLLEFAKSKEIVIARMEANGQQVVFPFNYKDALKGKNLHQNILLKPGDTVLVP